MPTVFVSRSTDDGRTWGSPISIPPPASNSVDLDKNWTACDNHPSSRFFGHCYTELDNFGDGDRELMSTSTDGGLTWSQPIQSAGHDKGLGGQPVVQPDGTVIVPYEALNGKIEAFRSTDGGASWTKAVTVGNIRFHGVAGDLRTSPLPTAEIAADGTAFVAWEDCRFRKRCGVQRHSVSAARPMALTGARRHASRSTASTAVPTTSSRAWPSTPPLPVTARTSR